MRTFSIILVTVVSILLVGVAGNLGLIASCMFGIACYAYYLSEKE